jgi:lipopolysaccharide transport system ATP-binding protein
MTTVERWCDLAAWVDGGRIRSLGRPLEVVRQYRQAVELAEAQQASNEPPAAANGLGAAAASEPASHRAVRIEGVRLVAPDGRDPALRDPEDGLEVVVDYTGEPSGELGFGVTLYRNDGLRLFAVDSFAQQASPSPVPPPRGQAVLTIDRLGLLPGDYRLDVAALKRSGEAYDVRHAAHQLTVSSTGGDQGVFRPPHRWSWKGPVA